MTTTSTVVLLLALSHTEHWNHTTFLSLKPVLFFFSWPAFSSVSSTAVSLPSLSSELADSSVGRDAAFGAPKSKSFCTQNQLQQNVGTSKYFYETFLKVCRKIFGAKCMQSASISASSSSCYIIIVKNTNSWWLQYASIHSYTQLHMPTANIRIILVHCVLHRFICVCVCVPLVFFVYLFHTAYLSYYCNMVGRTWRYWSLILRNLFSFSALTLLVGSLNP